ncbi:XRE family transcriptional regulator [Ornithobacterium rhinotracheale]
MQTIAEKIKKKYKTPYQSIAEKFNTSTFYVSKIARGERKPVRGKGLKIKKELEKLINQ